ncbi:tyrosine-type recombinase/integrase [Kutzneria sp. NPDC052558]|uniref:tyrosine-type recombinase/integrase n=1 Tax=Kutzneria sp. NPDC052558 TaxID=3364121 RepID=UPI0037C882A3
MDNHLVFAPPKGGKTRALPLAPTVLGEIDAYMEEYPPVAVTLPWKEPGSELETVSLILVNEAGAPINRSDFNRLAWRPALDKAGMGHAKRRDGMSALRHFFASTLLDAGESIKALAEWLGHSDPAFTMRFYTHRLPSSNERTQKAVDKALQLVQAVEQPDGPDTACAA